MRVTTPTSSDAWRTGSASRVRLPVPNMARTGGRNGSINVGLYERAAATLGNAQARLLPVNVHGCLLIFVCMPGARRGAPECFERRAPGRSRQHAMSIWATCRASQEPIYPLWISGFRVPAASVHAVEKSLDTQIGSFECGRVVTYSAQCVMDFLAQDAFDPVIDRDRRSHGQVEQIVASKRLDERHDGRCRVE